MDGYRVRTSLRRAESGFTEGQLAERQNAYEARLYRERGKVVIDATDCGENFIVLGWFKNLVKARFG